jgi:uncharacterized membrane protein YphA (DoxX/SURF4 family)
MANFRLPQLSVERVLGIGLGFTFLYAGIASLTNPMAWIGYFPAWTAALAPAETLILVHGAIQAILGLALAMNFALRITALVAVADLAAIILFYGIDAVTFRDVGLLIMAAALFRIAMGDLNRA